ncbi:MAG: hypothetical protein WC102_01640 [Saccharofermentanales bacterium]
MVEPETDFEYAVLAFCEELGQMLIEKNRKYGDSFRNLRKDAAHDLGNPRIPLWLHMKEKLSRYMENHPDDEEDICKDGAGYWILECICSRFDDQIDQLPGNAEGTHASNLKL